MPPVAAPPLAALEELPGFYRGLAAEMRQAMERWAAASAQSFAGSIVPGVVALRSARVSTRLFFTVERGGFRFGFARRTARPDVLLDCTVSFAVTPEREPSLLPPLQPSGILHQVWLPAMLATEPTAAERAAAGEACHADPDDLEFVRLDGGWLGVSPEDRDTVRMAWRLDHQDQWQSVVESVVRPGGGGVARRWRIPPFLALARTMGRWIRGIDPPVSRHVALPAVTAPDRVEASLFVLNALSSAWAGSVNEIEGRSSPDTRTTVERMLTPAHAIAGYRAEVRLLVDANGRLVRRAGSPDAIQLRAALTATEDDRGVARTEITMEPPDFLAAGDLYESFLDELASPAASRWIAGQLGFPGQDAAVRTWIAGARRSPVSSPVVFRVRRGNPDTNIAIIHGLFLSRSIHVALRGQFAVDAAQSMVTVDPGSLEVLLVFPPIDGRAPDAERPEALVEALFRLTRTLLNWRSALS